MACRKELGHKISDGEIIKTIESLKEIASLRKWFSEKEILLNEYFADTVTGETSDYDSVGSSLTLFSLLTQLRRHYTDLAEKLTIFSENENALKDHYQFLYNGIFTDWSSVSSAWKWAEEFRETILKYNPSQIFVKKVCASVKYAEECVALKKELTEIDASIRAEIAWFTKLFDEPEVFNEHNLRELYDRLDGCMNGMALLEEWIDFRIARENCCSAGLSEAVAAIESNNVPLEKIIPVFKKRFFSLWLDAVLPEYPAVLNFRRKTQEKTMKEFSALDRSQFDIARARIKSKLINDLPSMDHFSSGQDEISIIGLSLLRGLP